MHLKSKATNEGKNGKCEEFDMLSNLSYETISQCQCTLTALRCAYENEVFSTSYFIMTLFCILYKTLGLTVGPDDTNKSRRLNHTQSFFFYISSPITLSSFWISNLSRPCLLLTSKIMTYLTRFLFTATILGFQSGDTPVLYKDPHTMYSELPLPLAVWQFCPYPLQPNLTGVHKLPSKWHKDCRGSLWSTRIKYQTKR